MFPYKHDPSKALVNELLSIIVHSTAGMHACLTTWKLRNAEPRVDQLTSTTSTIPYHADELHKMMTIVKNAKGVWLCGVAWRHETESAFRTRKQPAHRLCDRWVI